MRYYFFETVEVDRGKGIPEPTLRPLPGQTFPRGEPVDVNYNVQSPKTAGQYPGGNRFDYPLGTRFCSSHLEIVMTVNGTNYYSVFKKGDQGYNQDPDFHPVSSDPNFNYVLPKHRSDKMNIAYALFENLGEQESGTNQQNNTTMAIKKTAQATGRLTPFDEKGRARAIENNWEPAYEGQLDTESNLIVAWMKRLLNRKGIRTVAKRPRLDAVTENTLKELFQSGETIDSIASDTRFNNICMDEKMDNTGLSNITSGPLDWYLNMLHKEHQLKKECSAISRDSMKTQEVEDAAFIICTQINENNGTTERHDQPETIANIAKALELGWTLDDIMEPSILENAADINILAKSLADGTIPLPERPGDIGKNSYIGKLMSNPKNTRPKDEDGFHVDEKLWRRLVRNLNRRENTLITGPTGTGKTQLIMKLCEQTGTPYTLIQMGSITDPTEQLVGKMDMESASLGTRFDWADFALAIQRPGVVILDEINRIPRNGTNILFSVLDGTRCIEASGAKATDKRHIDVHPDCCFFATANIGDIYVGTNPIDEALGNRFTILKLEYLDEETEKNILMAREGISATDARNIALIAKGIRQKARMGKLESSMSTRESLKCAAWVKDGEPIEDALEVVLKGKFSKGLDDDDPRSEWNIVKADIASLFN